MEKQSRGNCFEGLIYPKEYIRNYEIIREKYNIIIMGVILRNVWFGEYRYEIEKIDGGFEFVLYPGNIPHQRIIMVS